MPRRGHLAKPVVVSSSNGGRFKNAEGKAGVEIALEKMTEGWRPVDAAVAGVGVTEADPEDTAVGYGGLPNEDGVVELDSCVMDGPSGLGGAVAALQKIGPVAAMPWAHHPGERPERPTRGGGNVSPCSVRERHSPSPSCWPAPRSPRRSPRARRAAPNPDAR